MQLSFQAHHPVPDFVIAGAMKAGTTSMHHILEAHDRVFIPDEEIFFFDVDDIEQHGDFFSRRGDDWSFHDFERGFERYRDWYISFFEGAGEDQIIGEDSTTYLASAKAPARIARLLPEAKIIVMMRDPVARCYSDYWHRVFTGRIARDFETTLEVRPGTLLSRSFYRRGVERFLEHFDREQIAFVIFEAFIEEPERVVAEVCEFLGLSPEIDLEAVESHRNRARVPRFERLKLATNCISFRKTARYYRRHLPDAAPEEASGPSIGERLREAWNRGVETAADLVGSAFRRRSYPPMEPSTRRFLTRLFEMENRGLGELIGRDLSEFWPTMQGD